MTESKDERLIAVFDMICERLDDIQDNIASLGTAVKQCQNHMKAAERTKVGPLDPQLVVGPVNWRLTRVPDLPDCKVAFEAAAAVVFDCNDRHAEPLWLWDWARDGKHHPAMQGVDERAWTSRDYWGNPADYDISPSHSDYLMDELTQRVMQIEKDPRLEGCLLTNEGATLVMWTGANEDNTDHNILIDEWIQIYHTLMMKIKQGDREHKDAFLYTLSSPAARAYDLFRRQVHDPVTLASLIGNKSHFFDCYCHGNPFLTDERYEMEPWVETELRELD